MSIGTERLPYLDLSFDKLKVFLEAKVTISDPRHFFSVQRQWQ